MGDIPPVADAVPGYDYSGWAGLVAPRETSRVIVDKVHAALEKTLALPEVRDGLARQGAEVFTGSPDDFREFLRRDQANTVKVIRAELAASLGRDRGEVGDADAVEEPDRVLERASERGVQVFHQIGGRRVREGGRGGEQGSGAETQPHAHLVPRRARPRQPRRRSTACVHSTGTV